MVCFHCLILNASSFKLRKEVLHCFERFSEYRCQSVISPVTRSGSRDRYAFVRLPRDFLFVRSGSSSIAPVVSTR
jgi:hypothetical protein